MPDLNHLLGQIDRLDQQATKGPWEKLGSTVESNGTYEDVITTEVDCSSYCYGGRGGGVLKDKDAEFIALSRTALPTLAQTVRAVLELHEPIDDHIHLRAKICSHRYCVDEALDQMEYPCPTVQAITDALGG